MVVSQAVGDISWFHRKVKVQLLELYKEEVKQRTGETDLLLTGVRVVMPIAILLVVDGNNGGYSTAVELASRFHLLDKESGSVLDFYFMGWEAQDQTNARRGIAFSLERFVKCREWFLSHGIDCFNGNADLLLLDAVCDDLIFYLDLSKTIHIDLSAAAKDPEFGSIGSFLQSLIRETRHCITQPERNSPTFRISDSLGLVSAKQSILDYFLSSWGKIFGAKNLKRFAVRSIGGQVELEEFMAHGVHQDLFQSPILPEESQ